MPPKKGGEERAGEEVGSEENGPSCCTERHGNWRSVSEARQSLGSHGSPH
jgi:hypothetical protein